MTKKDRQAELLSGRMAGQAGAAGQQNNDWINELKLHHKTGAILPILKNIILFLCNHPERRDVPGFNEFAAQVVVRRRPYWGDVEPDTAWIDHFENPDSQLGSRKWTFPPIKATSAGQFRLPPGRTASTCSGHCSTRPAGWQAKLFYWRA